MSIIREITKDEAVELLNKHGLSERSLPYRGYATTLSDDGKTRTFIGYSPDRQYLLQKIASDAPANPGPWSSRSLYRGVDDL